MWLPSRGRAVLENDVVSVPGKWDDDVRVMNAKVMMPSKCIAVFPHFIFSPLGPFASHLIIHRQLLPHSYLLGSHHAIAPSNTFPAAPFFPPSFSGPLLKTEAARGIVVGDLSTAAF